MPWQADLIAKCRSSIGEVKHRMETRSGAIGQPISAMDRAAAGQPISAMEGEAGMSGSQRIRKMRAKNKAATGPTGGSAYRRYMRKKSTKGGGSPQSQYKKSDAGIPSLEGVYASTKGDGGGFYINRINQGLIPHPCPDATSKAVPEHTIYTEDPLKPAYTSKCLGANPKGSDITSARRAYGVPGLYQVVVHFRDGSTYRVKAMNPSLLPPK